MTAVFLFALTLFAAMLLSDLAERSIFSTTVLFLVAGTVVGSAGFVLVEVRPETPLVSEIVILALFATLFTDGMRVGIRDLAGSWRLPGRVLLLGFPLTVLGTALLGRYLAGLDWHAALLLGAVLAPTDPVFASTLVQREDLSGSLRRLLNVESGINDGLALPLVLWLLHTAGSDGTMDLVIPLAEGLGIGIAVPWIADRLERSRFFRAHSSYGSLAGFAVALLVLSVTQLSGANEFLAAFAAGVTVVSVRPDISEQFRELIAGLADLLKFAGVFLFGALLSPALLRGLGAGDYLFALLALVAVRPVVLSLALWGSGMNRRERLVASGFGPKGFASVLFAIMVLRSGDLAGGRLFHLAAVVIAGSIVLYSSTDILAARWLARGGQGHISGQSWTNRS